MGTAQLLSLGLATDSAVKGYQAGQSKAKQTKIADESRMLVREQARQQSQAMDYKLAAAGRADQQASATQDATIARMQEEQQQLAQQAHSLGAKDFRNSTYHALDALVKDGSYKQFNNFLTESNSNPYAPQTFKDVVRVDPVTMDTQEGMDALKAAGFDKTMLDSVDGKVDGALDWEKIKKRFVLATTTDGKQEVRDVLHLGVVTGYGEYTDAKGLAKLKAMADLKKAMTPAKDPTYKTPNALIKADAIGTALDAQKAGNATSAQKVLITQYRADTGGKTAGNLALVEQARAAWRSNGFDKLSQADLQSNPDARALVNQIEVSHALKASTIKQLTELKPMIDLASEAVSLSGTQTGLWDKMTNNISSYVSNNITDKVAKASYGAFINQFRHNLFGSALTAGELEAFQQAYGSLGNKVGPVLAGLRAAVVQVKSKMQVLANIEDPMVMQFRAGMSMEKGKSTLAMLDKRIAFYDLLASNKGLTPNEAAAQVGLTVGTAAPKNVQNKVPTMSVQEMMGQL